MAKVLRPEVRVEVHLSTIARLSDQDVAVLKPLSARNQDTLFSEHNLLSKTL